MSHASVLVALSPADLKKAKGDVHKAVARQMAPFDEDGGWFKEGSRWDWWVIGGRFTGRFAAPGYDPTTDPANLETCFICGGSGKRDDALGRNARLRDPGYTCNGCQGTGRQVKHPPQWIEAGNVITRGELSEEKLKEVLLAKARARWVEYQKADPKTRGFIYDEPDGVTEEAFVAARTRGFSCHAFLKDREWHESGRLGWFGSTVRSECEIKAAEDGKEFVGRCIHTAKAPGGGSAKIVDWTGPKDSDEKWQALFWARFIRPLPPDYTLVVVDYHV